MDSATANIKIANSKILQQLMERVQIDSYLELSRKAQVAELQIFRLQNGLIEHITLKTLSKIALALNIGVYDLMEAFYTQPTLGVLEGKEEDNLLRQEYAQLAKKLELVEQTAKEELQKSSLETIESWLLQWPTLVKIVQKNPKLPASKLLPLLKPIQQLLTNWGVEAIASVGDKIPYNPKEHELMEGSAREGELVEVRYVGYRQGDRLLYRSKVSKV